MSQLSTPPGGTVAPPAQNRIQLAAVAIPPAVPGGVPKRVNGIPGEMMFECWKALPPWSVSFIRQLYQSFARGGSMVDVGANIGTNILLATDFFRRCYAIEPSSTNVAILRYNIQDNHLANVEVLPIAVSNTAGTAKLFLDGSGNSGAHSLCATHVPGMRGYEEVPVLTLDAALPNVTDVTFMHIDTEGNDIKVLQGAREFVRRQALRPAIEIEFSPRSLARSGSSVTDLIAFLDEFDYQVSYSASNNMAPLSRTILLEMFYLWQNCGGWIDLYLLPGGPKFN
jgi:FkbM family methyltransferase